MINYAAKFVGVRRHHLTLSKPVVFQTDHVFLYPKNPVAAVWKPGSEVELYRNRVPGGLEINPFPPTAIKQENPGVTSGGGSKPVVDWEDAGILLPPEYGATYRPFSPLQSAGAVSNNPNAIANGNAPSSSAPSVGCPVCVNPPSVPQPAPTPVSPPYSSAPPSVPQPAPTPITTKPKV